MNRTFLVIGLGTFGSRAARALVRGGATVLVIDWDEEKLEPLSELVAQAVCADALDLEAMQAIGAFDADVALVALRRHFDTTVLVTRMLKNQGVKEVHCQIDSEREAEAIRAIGATTAIFPEQDMAESLAMRLMMPNLADRVPLGSGVGMVEITAPALFEGRNLIELQLRKKFGVNVVALKRYTEDAAEEPEIEVAPPAENPIHEGEVLVLVGKTPDLNKFQQHVQKETEKKKESKE